MTNEFARLVSSISFVLFHYTGGAAAFLPLSRSTEMEACCRYNLCGSSTGTYTSIGMNGSGDISDEISSILSRLTNSSNRSNASPAPRVIIMGTGVSNELITLPLPSLSILAKADVVLHDSLSLPAKEINKIVKADCIVRSCGKRGDRSGSIPQQDIDELIVEYSLRGYDSIVRLKGGDPFIFGRTRTEIEALRKNNISYQVVPNLSSSVSGPHYAGIPLTDPILQSDSFAVFSGTNAEGKGIGTDDKAWDNLPVDTLVFLMIGRLDKLDQLGTKLMNSGGDRWIANTPCAIIRNAGREDQEVWRATLATIVQTIQEDVGQDCTTVSPAIFVVGRVTSLDLRGFL